MDPVKLFCHLLFQEWTFDLGFQASVDKKSFKSSEKRKTENVQFHDNWANSAEEDHVMWLKTPLWHCGEIFFFCQKLKRITADGKKKSVTHYNKSSSKK